MPIIVGTQANDTITGTAVNDIILGQGGDDTIDGGSGVDRMAGGIGNDTYVVNSFADQVFENANEGFDTVNAFVNFTLPANVEALVLQGTAATGTGNALDNVITGSNAGNTISGAGGNDTLSGLGGRDVLSGGAGADTMIGGAGNDDFFVDNAGDVVIDLDGDAFDRIITTIDLTLPIDIENVRVASSAGLSVTGNDKDNLIDGGDGNDVLSAGFGKDNIDGDDGNDTLFGGEGNDDISGFTGDDTIDGGGGDDTIGAQEGIDLMFGGAGNDVFQYDLGDGSDLIADFEGAGIAVADVILLQLTGLDNFAELLPFINDVVGGCEVRFNDADVLSLRNISKAQLDANDFAFG
jgi:Ca2+-binding RTX toxin-like protein